MVYCGKPSSCCAICRVRKRKCDKAQPACGQCVQSGVECPGFRDPKNLVFRDESSRIIDKALADNKKSRTRENLSQTETESANQSRDLGRSETRSHKRSRTSSTSEMEYRKPSALPSPDPSFPPSQNGSDIEAGEEVEVENHTTLGEVENDSDVFFDLTTFAQDQLAFDFPIEYLSPAPSMPTLPYSLQDIGVTYFMSHFVDPGSGPSLGYFSYIREMLEGDDGEDALRSAVEACGLASLSNATNQPEILGRAQSAYARTIEELNKALADTLKAHSEGTILSVLILGLYESVTCSSRDEVEARAKHMHGLIAILVHRGSSRFQSPLGRKVFKEVIAHVLDSCMQTRTRMPPYLRLLRAEFSKVNESSTLSWLVAGALIEIMELYHVTLKVASESCSDDTLEGFLLRAVEIDRELESRFAQVPPDWRYKTVEDPSASATCVYQGKYHVYRDSWVPYVWNNMRSCRIHANLVIRKTLPLLSGTLSGGDSNLLSNAVDTQSKMANDILASVPQVTGFVHHQGSTGDSSLMYREHVPFDVGCSSSSYFLLGSLHLIGTLPETSAPTIKWIAGRLQSISEVTGIRKAQYLINQQ